MCKGVNTFINVWTPFGRSVAYIESKIREGQQMTPVGNTAVSI